MYPAVYADQTPDKPVCIVAETGEVVTYRDLDRGSNRLAHYLRSIGLRRGDTIAILLENHPRYYEVCWAALRSGLFYVPINWHLTPPEITYVLGDCGAKVLVTSAVQLGLVRGLDLRATALETTVLIDGTSPGCVSYEEAVAAMPDTPLPDESEGSDMIYTSGSTGRPKGGFHNLRDGHPSDPDPRSVAFIRWFGLDEDSVYLMPGAPLYHAAPLRFTMGLSRLGGTNVIMQRFDPLVALEAIERYGVTHSQWVPTMFVRLLRLVSSDRSRFDLSTHRMAIHAAAPCPVEIKEQMIDWWGPIVVEYYGASEGGSITTITSDQWLAHKGSVGTPIIGSIHIVGDDGEEVPTGQDGVIHFADGIRIQYHDDPDKTAKAYDKHGWSTVGDVGHLDADGYLYLTDRKDHMIVSGGVNIYPQEAEAVLIQHPAVADVAVIGVPNADMGEEVRAVVQLLDDSARSPELAAELVAFCRARIAAYKCPRQVDFEAELPRAPSGKLYKRRLRERYWEGHTTSIV